MKFQCPDCGFTAQVDPGKIPPNVKTATCPKCKSRFPLKRPVPSRNAEAPQSAPRPKQPDPKTQPRPRAKPQRSSPPTSSILKSRSVLLGLVVLIAVIVAAGWWLGARETVDLVATTAPVQAKKIAKTDKTNVQAKLGKDDVVRGIAPGNKHTAFVRNDGTIWIWGYNEDGQLGNGQQGFEQKAPAPLKSIDGFTAVASGWGHTIALRQDGTVWGWGHNKYGQVGCNTLVENILKQTQVFDIDNVVAIAAGGRHSLALKGDGSVWSWGNNMAGQLGDHGLTKSSNKPIEVANVSNVTAIAAGRDYSLAINSDGDVYMWGGLFARLPDELRGMKRGSPLIVAGLPPVDQVAAGEIEAIGVDRDGIVWRWGEPHFFTDDEKKSMDLNEIRSKALAIIPSQVAGIESVQKVAAGNQHFLALKADGSVWGWGSNGRKQLGSMKIKSSKEPIPIQRYKYDQVTAKNADQFKPLGDIIDIAAGGTTSYAIDQAGAVWSWGDDSYGQRGISGKFKPVLPWRIKTGSPLMTLNNVEVETETVGQEEEYFVPVVYQPEITVVASGSNHSLYADSEGTLWAWGRNDDHQLGCRPRGKIKECQVKIDDMGPVKEVAANWYYSLALEGNGKLWMWGRNEYRKNTEYPEPQVLLDGIEAIDAGNHFFLALDQMGKVFTWGDVSMAPREKTVPDERYKKPVPVPLLENITQVAAGKSHALALDSNGDVYAWGDNKYGQLGIESKISRAEPVPVVGLDNVEQIAAGSTISMALKDDGTVWAWGKGIAADFNGRTLQSSTRPIQVVGLDEVAAICCGGFISEGEGHNLALKKDGTIWAWGNNSFGQVGDGTTGNYRSQPVKVIGMEKIVVIGAGNQQSLAIDASGRIWGWGNNMRDQLGVGGGIVSRPRMFESGSQ